MYLLVAQVPHNKSSAIDSESEKRMISARESVLRWFVAFTVRFKRTDSASKSPSVNQSVVSISSAEGSEPVSPLVVTETNRFSPARNKEYLHDASDVIRKVLYSTRSNVRLLHEVLRQVKCIHYTYFIVSSTKGLYRNNHASREIDHNTGNYVAYSLRTVSGFFNVPQNY